jgi:hypothetical protein
VKLKLAEGLSLPLETVTQTIAILAKRRAGKSYTMRRLVEQLFGAGQQIVIVDPKGDQWGVRSAADGKAPGLPIVILGGERGDVPLEPSGGEVVAKLVVEERVSVLLDVSLFRKHEVATFMTAFLENLYRLKAREIYRTPLMLVIDEADAIAPQKPQKGEERMLGAAEDIVRRGGQRGIGCVLVTQRSAVLNKNVLTQAQMLVALRTIAPQDLAAMDAWIDVHGTVEQRKALMESLPSLPIGDAWFWSPGWPTTDGIFKRVHVLPIETFDSGATPRPGEKRVEPKQAADVDLEALKRQMQATIEKAKADDPRELRKTIADLKKQLGSKVSIEIDRKAVSPSTPKRVEVLTDADRALLEKFAGVLNARAGDLRATTAAMIAEAAEAFEQIMRRLEAVHAGHQREFLERLDKASFQKILGKLSAVSSQPSPIAGRRDELTSRALPGSAPSRRAELGGRVRQSSTQPAGVNGTYVLGKGGDARMLAALAQFPDGLTDSKLAILSGMTKRGGAFRTYLSKLRVAGLATGDRGRLRITEAGQTAAGDVEPLPTGDALLDYWRRELGDSGARKIFDALVEVYPQALTKADTAAASAMEVQGGAFRTYVSKLRVMGLIEGSGELRASEELFS